MSFYNYLVRLACSPAEVLGQPLVLKIRLVSTNLAVT